MDFIPALSQLPVPSAQRIALRISTPGERALKQGHPWVFDQSITEQSRDGSPGDLAVIFDDKRRFLAVGLYDPTSTIRVRILQKIKPASIDANWFEEKIKTAAAIRAPLSKKDTNGYRLVHGENDGLPGLVIDRYAETLVLKLYTPAWVPHLNDVIPALEKTQVFSHLILRLNRSLQKQTEYLHSLTDGMTLTPQTPEGLILFKENGITFECDPINGQKTGFFLDQRENRERVRTLSKGKSVLNVFSYTGGFSLYAADGGANQVTSVDFSTPATQATLRNIQHNQYKTNIRNAKFETLDKDAFEALAQMKSQNRQFDIVILDPPMFAQNQSQVETALAAYRRLTHLGLDVLKRGGILVQASCSSRVSADDFFNAIHNAAQEAGRPLKEIERTGHALDHPTTYKEGAYLSVCLLLRHNPYRHCLYRAQARVRATLLFFVAKQSYELILRLLRAEEHRPRNDGNYRNEVLMSRITFPNSLITPQFLFENLSAENLVILDASMKPVTPVGEAVADAYIPNSLRFDYDNDIKDHSTMLPHMMPTPEFFTERMQAMSINKDSAIVVYDNVGVYASPRAWWMFRAMGHDNVAVLDGGLPAWIRAGYETTTTLATPKTRGDFASNPRPGLFVDSQAVTHALSDSAFSVMDARSAGRFKGQEKEPRAGLRGGHMPGAVNLPFSETQTNGVMKAPALLREMFKEYQNKKLIFSCGTGVTACILALAAEQAGHKDLAVYDGSWTEWGAMDSGLPVVKIKKAAVVIHPPLLLMSG